ncbi:MAG: type II toxin-antitoxin system prevent-host-death family antitoxin [Anaerolineales bacterium]|nr:type II toxin-antitoxin system prevent-host-death family antitoxin [Anaerolineales bacterium]
MSETTVGARELKNNLSQYLRRVKEGEIILITERGKAIGQIMPVPETLEEKMKALAAAGIVEWSGKKLKPRKPTIVNRGPKLASEIVSEGRDVDYLP